jgi:hypothetical protein
VKSCIGVLAFLLLQQSPTSAQTAGVSLRPETGTRIRVPENRSSRREGILVEWRGDSVLARIDSNGEDVLIPPQGIPDLERFDRMATGTATGALIGGGLGLALSLIGVASTSEDDFYALTTGEKVAGVALMTVVTTGVGALIGSFVKVTKWRPFDSSAPRLQAMVDPRGRMGLAVRIGF